MKSRVFFFFLRDKTKLAKILEPFFKCFSSKMIRLFKVSNKAVFIYGFCIFENKKHGIKKDNGYLLF